MLFRCSSGDGCVDGCGIRGCVVMDARGCLEYLEEEFDGLEHDYFVNLSNEQVVDLVSALRKLLYGDNIQKDVCPFCKAPLSRHEVEGNFCGVCEMVLVPCEECPIDEPTYTHCLVCNQSGGGE